MKVVYPKNIKKWLFAGMTFTIGPLTISIIQLFVLAVGVSLALAAFNGIAKSWSKALGLLAAIFILFVFIVVTFFKISEMGLIEYIAKIIRNTFFDTKKKYQVNYEKQNPVDVYLQEAKTKEEKQLIEQKEHTFDQNMLKDIEKKWLI